MAAGGEALAVGAESHAADGALVAPEGELLLPRLGVPHLHFSAEASALRIKPAAAGGEARAVGAVRHAGDNARVPLECELQLSRPGVPHLHLSPRLHLFPPPSGL